MRRAAALLLLLGATACVEEPAVRIDTSLSVAPGVLEAGRLFIGHPVELPLTVTNASRAERVAQLHTSAPATVPAQVGLPPGGTVAVQVRLAPLEPGPFEVLVGVQADSSSASVRVVGEAVVPPVCSAVGECRESRFDPVRGECVESNRPEGEACGGELTCIADGRCTAGRCVGGALGCDDANACTADACAVGAGCSHQSTVSSCPVPSDPCRVPTCDRTGGCGEAPAADGTVCGTVDCVTAHICLLGICKAAAVPEGTRCSEPTPCRAEGRCTAGRCAEPDAGLLVPEWRFAPPTGWRLSPPMVDSAGNLHVVECGGGCSHVSFTPNGFLRFRAPLFDGGAGGGSTGELIAGDRLIASNRTQGLEAHDTLDGRLLWSSPFERLTEVAIGSLPSSDGGPPVGGLPAWRDHYGSVTLLAMQGELLVVGVMRMPDQGAVLGGGESFVLGIDPTNGALRFRTPLALQLGEGLVDERLQLLARGLQRVDAGNPQLDTVTWRGAFAPGGVPITRLPGDPPLPTAAFGGWAPSSLPLADGGAPFTFQVQEAVGTAMDSRDGFAFGSTDCASCSDEPFVLAGFEPFTHAARFTRDMALGSTWPTGRAVGTARLTDRRSALVAASVIYPPGTPAPGVTSPELVLSEVDWQGGLRWSCRAEVGRLSFGVIPVGLLTAGRWTFISGTFGNPELRSYALPGVAPARRGWLGNRGDLGQANRAVP